MPEIVETDPPQDAEADVEEQLAHQLAPSPMEPNYDAYVPALQLQDCDDSQSVKDSAMNLTIFLIEITETAKNILLLIAF